MTSDPTELPEPLKISDDLRRAIEHEPVTGELKGVRKGSTDVSETGQLRGDLARSIGEVSSDAAFDTIPANEIAVGESIINRDGENVWEIVNLVSDDRGNRVQLLGPDGQKATLGLDRLKKQLETEGEAWHW